MNENNEPTQLTVEDIHLFFSKLMNGDYDRKFKPCFECGKDFLANYDLWKCDECYFNQFPKKEVKNILSQSYRM